MFSPPSQKYCVYKVNDILRNNWGIPPDKALPMLGFIKTHLNACLRKPFAERTEKLVRQKEMQLIPCDWSGTFNTVSH
jgi:hypothetical protein